MSKIILIRDMCSGDIGDLITDIPFYYNEVRDVNSSDIVPHDPDDLVIVFGNVLGDHWLTNLHYILKNYKCKIAGYALGHNFDDLATNKKYPDTLHLLDIVGISDWDDENIRRFTYSPNPIYKKIFKLDVERSGTIEYTDKSELSPQLPRDTDPEAYWQQVVTEINKHERIITDNYYGVIIGLSLGLKVVCIPKRTSLMNFSHMPEYAENLEEARKKDGFKYDNYNEFNDFYDTCAINSINRLIKNELRVAYNITSHNLGDNLCWIGQILRHSEKPYIKKCYLKTAFPDLVRDLLKNSKVLLKKPTVNSYDVYRTLGVGQVDKWRIKNVEQIASENLGIKYEPNRYSLQHLALERPRTKKYITYASHGSWSWKSWQYPDGWKILKKMVKDKLDLDMIDVSIESGEIDPDIVKGAITYIYHSELFIGGPSGLTWLCWYLGKDPLLLSGVTLKGTEMVLDDNHEIRPTSGCRNCYNYVVPFNSSNTCAMKKDYECWKNITPEMVYDKIVKILGTT